MAGTLAPHIDRCIFSFVEMYSKLDTYMPKIVPLTDGDKETPAERLGSIAGRHGMIQICGTNTDLPRYGIETSGCMTLDILGETSGIEFRDLKNKGMRHGCRCIESRDIGAYDACPNGCRYCYANSRPQRVAENRRMHDPTRRFSSAVRNRRTP